jgi:hypothetical protein
VKRSLSENGPATLVVNEISVTRLPTGLVSVQARYTVDLRTEEFSGSVGVGSTTISDDDLIQMVDEAMTAIQNRINSAVGLAAPDIAATVETPEQDWEL